MDTELKALELIKTIYLKTDAETWKQGLIEHTKKRREALSNGL